MLVIQVEYIEVNMPLKMFCDRCEDETAINYASTRAILSLDGWKLEIMICNPQHVWNDGILCEECLRYLLRESPLRPKGKGE